MASSSYLNLGHENDGHKCQLPGRIQRMRDGAIQGTQWQCECRRIWRLEFGRWVPYAWPDRHVQPNGGKK